MSAKQQHAQDRRSTVLRAVISMTILVLFFAWVAWYASGNAALFRPLTQVRAVDLAALFLAFLAMMVCNGIFISIVTRAFRIHLRAREWLSLSFASSFANFFLPLRGGAGIRAVYMYQVYRFPVAEFVSTLSIMYLMHVVVNAFLALAGMLVIAWKAGPVNVPLLVLFGSMAVAGSIAMVADVRLNAEHRGFPLAQLSRLLSAWSTVRQDRVLVVRLWLLMMALTSATVWQCFAAFKAAGIELAADGIVVYAACKNLGSLIGITPGSLGIVELISIYLGKILGYGTADALIVQGLIRAVSIVVLLLAAPVAVIYLKHRLRSADLRIAEAGRAK